MQNINPIIRAILMKLPDNLIPHTLPDGSIVCDDTHVVLRCDVGHTGKYLLKSVSQLTKCSTCDCSRVDTTIRSSVEFYFKTPFSKSETDSYKFVSEKLKIKIYLGSTAGSVGSADGYTEIRLAPPYTLKSLKPAIRRLCEQSVDKFEPTAAAIIKKSVRAKMIKEPLPFTRDLLAKGDIAGQFDPSLLPDNESQSMCIENCLYN